MAVDMFLKLGDIKGEAHDDKFKDWIDVLAFSWGMSQSGTMHAGGGGGSGKVNVQDMAVTKWQDKASADIMLKCCTGKHYDDATLVLRKAGDEPLEFMTYKLKEVLITSVSMGASGGEDRMTENISMNFAEFDTEYKMQGAKGKQDGGGKVAYSMKKNKKI